jgi:hypothetical protein
MLYLARKQFPDRMMDDRDLDAVADLWREWYMRKAWPRRDSDAYQFLELRLWGFARERGPVLLRLLQERLADHELPERRIELADPDTITLTSPPVPVSHFLPRGLWLELFRAADFSGLPLMVRLTISADRDQTRGHPAKSAGLVLVGQLHEERLQLKAVWPGSLNTEPFDPFYRMAAWPQEQEFLQALDTFQRTSKAVPVSSGVFVSRSQERTAYWYIRLLFDVPGEKRKVLTFLCRIGFFAALTLLAGVWLYFVFGIMLLRVAPVLLGLLGLAGLGFNLWWKARMVHQYHSRMKAALRKLYSHSVSYPAVDLAELGVADNPAVLKYSAELEAADARHLIDVRVDPPTNSLAYIRIFQIPDIHSYVFLNIMLATKNIQFFPAHPFLMVMTYFADESRLTSTNATAAGFRKQRRPNVVMRRFPDAQNPGDLIDRHRQVLKRLLDDGRVLAPLMSAQGLLDTQVKLHDETCALAKQQGYYTWGAALRHAFGIVRPEYVEE